MRGTKEAGVAQYGAANVLYPGRRTKQHGYDTSIGNTVLSTLTTPTINAARVATTAAIIASRVVTNVRTGLALRAES